MELFNNAFELTSYINDLCVAHDVDGLHMAMVVGCKIGEMKAGDTLTVCGGGRELKPYIPVFDKPKFILHIVKASQNRGYMVERDK